MVPTIFDTRAELMVGGSGNGIHNFLSTDGCARAANIRASLPIATDPSAPVVSRDSGTFFHAMLREYYKGTIETSKDFSWALHSIAWEEALNRAIRAFDAYVKNYSSGEWGTNPRVEEHFTFTSIQQNPTARFDLVATLTEQDISLLKTTSPDLYDIIEPGVYIVDHKLFDRRPNLIEYQNSVQMLAYQVFWNSYFQDKCKGAIVNVTVPLTRSVDFYRIFVPPPRPDQVKMVFSLLARAEKTLVRNEPNLTNCFKFGKPCPYLDIQCDRS